MKNLFFEKSAQKGSIMDMVISAKQVQKGDYLFNAYAQHPAFQWVRVTEVEQREDKQICLTTIAWQTILHPEEGIAVRRYQNERK